MSDMVIKNKNPRRRRRRKRRENTAIKRGK
jgi:hypothetical protein